MSNCLCIIEEVKNNNTTKCVLKITWVRRGLYYSHYLTTK